MSAIGSGGGTSYPSAIDTAITEVNDPNVGKTKARAEVPNDQNSAIIAVETTLGTSPQGTAVDVKTFLQTEHGVDGTHDPAIIVKTTGNQTIAGVKTYSDQQIWSKGADVPSAATLALGTDGNFFDITGTTSITGIQSKGVGTTVTLQFDDVLTVTHHATNLILPGGVNMTTKAGDVLVFFEYSSADWILVSGTIVTTPMIAANAVTPDKYNAMVVGDFQNNVNTPERSTTSLLTLVKLKESKVAFDGAYRVEIDHKGSGTFQAHRIQVYKNGSAEGILQTALTNGTYVTFSEDISGVSAGDLIQIYGAAENSVDTCLVEKLDIRTNEPCMIAHNASF
jgi:hypothetical protein